MKKPNSPKRDWRFTLTSVGSTILFLLIVLLPIIRGFGQIAADANKQKMARNKWDSGLANALRSQKDTLFRLTNPEPDPYNYLDALVKCLSELVLAAFLGMGMLIIRASRSIREAAGKIESLQTMQGQITTAQDGIKSLVELVTSEHQYLQVLKALDNDADLQAFVITQANTISTSWLNLLNSLDLVGKPDRPDRMYWKKILSTYVEAEVRDLGDRVVAANIELYVKLLEKLTESAQDVREGAICLFAVNSVLPENWYNWPYKPEAKEGNGKATYAPLWLKEFRENNSRLIRTIAQSHNIEFERITIVLPDDPKVISRHSTLKRLGDLRNQAGLLIAGDSQGAPQEANFWRALAEQARTLPPEIPKANEPVYWISQHAPPESSNTPRLVQKFIDDLHPSPGQAKYKVLTGELIKEMDDQKLPLEFILAGYRNSEGEDPKWVFAVAADDLDLERKTVLIRLFGLESTQPVQPLEEWRKKVTQGTEMLQSLLR